MAISKIKKDENGKPLRCKYCIVVLGNLDNYNWHKSDCFAPVLSQPEMRLLTSIATRMKRIPKSGDVSQAFCQGVLPPTKQYVIRPPPGCPYTPKNSYWRLLRTLYGLKRSPRHWYEKAKSILLSIGLKPLRNSHCIFKGSIIPGQPPLYISLYVDDFIYFSESDLVERTFEDKFGSAVSTTFEGDVTHFLGINFQSTRHDDGHVTIHLSQEAFIDSLMQRTHLDSPDVIPVPSPYRSAVSLSTNSLPLHPTSIKPHKTVTTTNFNNSPVPSNGWLHLLGQILPQLPIFSPNTITKPPKHILMQQNGSYGTSRVPNVSALLSIAVAITLSNPLSNSPCLQQFSLHSPMPTGALKINPNQNQQIHLSNFSNLAPSPVSSYGLTAPFTGPLVAKLSPLAAPLKLKYTPPTNASNTFSTFIIYSKNYPFIMPSCHDQQQYTTITLHV